MFYIGVLTVQPSLSVFANKTETEEACNDQCCSDEQNCSDEKSCDDQKGNCNDCCPGGICNPFESCACCFGFSITKPIVEITTNHININYTQSEIKKIHYGYGSHCFHPPEVI